MVKHRKRSVFAIILLIVAFVLVSVILSMGNFLSANAYKASTAVPDSIGSLSFTDYETLTNGAIFDAEVLDKLYGIITASSTGKDTYANAYNAVKDSQSDVMGSAKKGTDDLSLNTQYNSMNYKTIKANNDGVAVTVEFGGYTWNVMYATTNTTGHTDGSGDLIITLWMSESVKKDDGTDFTVPWGGFTGTTTYTGEYASSEYSMSKIRIETLNGGDKSYADTKYATGTAATNTATVTKEDRAKNQFAKFTLTNEALTTAGQNSENKNKSLVDYLVSPNQITYQKAENWVWSFYSAMSNATPRLLLNEAWGKGADGPDTGIIYPSGSKTGGWTNDMTKVIDNTNYFAWANDYLWLPSLTETGSWGSTSIWGASLWGIDISASTTADNLDPIILPSSTSWTRSNGINVPHGVMYITTSGARSDTAALTGAGSFRPALHLNLTKAAANAMYKVDVPPSIADKVFNDKKQGIEDETWFSGVSGGVTVKYFDTDAKTEVTGDAPKYVGNYEAQLTLTDNKYFWGLEDNTNKTVKLPYKINKKSLDYPSWLGGSCEGTYNGGNDINFRLTYDTNLITVTAPSGVTIGANKVSVTASEVGEYTFTVVLNDTKNYKWSSDKNELKLVVKPMPLGLSLTDGSGNTDFTSSTSSNLSGIITVDVTDHEPLHSGKQVVVNIIAEFSDPSSPEEIIGSVTLDSVNSSFPVSFDFSSLLDGLDYKLKLEVDNTKSNGGNYVADQITKNTLTLEAGMRTMFTWRLMANESLVFNQSTNAAIGENSIAFSGNTITYDGKKYIFTVLTPTGYTIDESYGVDGYLVVPGTSGNSNAGTNADKYTTKVQVINDGNTEIYEITWEIKQAKFDLSKVKWVDNGEIPYTGNTVTETLDLTNLPAGLTPSYSGVNTGKEVGDHGTVNVAFADLTGDYLVNYVKPTSTDIDSYIGSFEWDKAWAVVKAKIPVVWDNATHNDKNGVPFTYPTIKGNYDNVLDYLFFETDVDGNILDADNPIGINDVEVDPNNRLFYKVKPVFKNATIANNYELDDVYSTYFPIGEQSEGVELGLEHNELQYTGKPQDVVIKVLAGTIGVNSLDIVYYDRNGVTPLSSAPINQGEYRVEISIKAGVNGFYLKGDNVANGTAVIDFEITKLIVDNSTWVTTHNPPSLKLTYAEIQGVTYDYADMDGNPLTFAQLKAGNSYKVRARIKDQNNYEFKHDFDGDFYITDWQVFTVSENEHLYDPTDPNNPFYPEDSDNPTPTPSDGGNGSGSSIKDFFEKLLASHFPLWQVAVMAVSALLALIFIIKAAQYGSRAKKAKGEAKKISSRAYAAILPVFASDVVALGLTNQIWSIMAFAFVGLALAMLVVALVMRSKWKKAELAKENALDEREQRKEAKQLEREEAEKQERREFQERMVTASQFGGDASSFEAILRQRDEEHRREIEALREEQAKRDETMKIMLANLMGRQQGDDSFAYASMDDTDLLVQRVIAGLLPAVQQMIPETTAYLAAPQEQNDELLALVEEQRAIAEEQRAIVEEQNEEIRNMSAQMNEMQEQQLAKIEALQQQIAAMAQDRVDGVIIENGNDEKMAEMADTMREQLAKIEELQAQLAAMEQERVDGVLLPDQSDDMKAMLAKMDELQAQLAAGAQDSGEGIVIPDQSEEIKALTEQIAAMREQLAERPQTITHTVYVERETDEEDGDDEEEWDSILDEEDDFVEATIVDADGTVRKTTPNFRMRLKESSDKNREWYAAIKNLFCSQKGVTYRVYKRVEKIRYQGQVIAVIGIAKRSIKLWLALKPFEYDARRYHHKDVSDKPRFVDVPLYVRVGSDRALTRAEELILALFQEQAMESRKRYNDRSIQELIFTLKHNRLLANKESKQLLCEVMHVHDCDVLDNESAEKCIETKNVDFIDESVIEQVKLDDIDANFQDGNRVTLDKLRKAGLVSEQCTGYTVTAGQRLTKPLIIVANDFTLEAVKMIVLTGGRVIRLTAVNN